MFWRKKPKVTKASEREFFRVSKSGDIAVADYRPDGFVTLRWVTLNREEALALADWIRDVFGSDEVKRG